MENAGIQVNKQHRTLAHSVSKYLLYISFKGITNQQKVQITLKKINGSYFTNKLNEAHINIFQPK